MVGENINRNCKLARIEARYVFSEREVNEFLAALFHAGKPLRRGNCAPLWHFHEVNI